MALPRDPELEPVPAAKAAMAEMPEFGAAPAARPAAAPARPGPAIRPADPGRWSVTHALEEPIYVDDVLLTEIVIRRPTTEQVWRVILEDDDETTLNLRIRAMMCGVHPAVLQGLWTDDGAAIAEKCRPFLPRAVADMEAEAAQALAAADGEG